MPNTVPAADTGLPKSDPPSCLIETDRGLAISRLISAKAMRPSMLAGEALDAFLAKLDDFVCAQQRYDELIFTRVAPGPECGEARDRAKSIRRSLIVPIRAIRTAKSKTIEDVLFKAEISEIIEPYECRQSNSIAHSLVNDLLSADCQWRAA